MKRGLGYPGGGGFSKGTKHVSFHLVSCGES